MGWNHQLVMLYAPDFSWERWQWTNIVTFMCGGLERGGVVGQVGLSLSRDMCKAKITDFCKIYTKSSNIYDIYVSVCLFETGAGFKDIQIFTYMIWNMAGLVTINCWNGRHI